MNQISHKPGIHENFLMTRHLRLEHLDPGCAEALVAELQTLAEVDEASITFGWRGVVLNIAYDASLSDRPLDDIRTVLQAHGSQLADDWWTRVKCEYIGFTDQNAYDNARQEPWCCHRLPPRK